MRRVQRPGFAFISRGYSHVMQHSPSRFVFELSKPQSMGRSARYTAGIAYSGLGETPKTADGAVKLYDEWADTYNATLASWGYKAPERVMELLKERVGSDAKVLDLGCGTGMSGEVLQQGGLLGKHVGVDISPKSVEIASNLGCYGGGVFVGSLEEPFPAPVVEQGPFDAVISVGVMSYVHEFSGLWRNVLDTLKPGGYLIITHRKPFWESDLSGIQTEAAKHMVTGEWRLEVVSEPMPYMPQNPDPAEHSKRIQYIIFRKRGGSNEKVANV